MNRLLFPVLASCSILLLSIPGAPQAKAETGASAGTTAASQPLSIRGDVVARVGGQEITFGEINTALNSSAIVGVSVPALGTPERDMVRITLLDRLVSANLLYLDARKQGLDQDPAYRRQVERFDDSILAGLYWQRVLFGEVPVNDEEIRAYHENSFILGRELTPGLRAAIASKLRREKVREQMPEARTQVREGVNVVVHEENLSTAGDADRADDVSLAEIDGEPLAWGAVKDQVIAAGKGAVMVDPLAMEDEARRRALETEIDLRIMADKARASGLDQDPVYRARTAEFHKNRLINLHRERLVKQMEPTKEELKAYYEANRATIMQPEARKIQMVVLETREEAEQIKARLDAGEITMFQAARDHSTAAKAKEDLGEVGWVNQGELVPELDEVVFSLGPGAIGGPVETPAGWHLVTVQDLADAKHTDPDEEATRKLVRRRYLDERLAAYTVELRKNDFPVEVYEDQLVQLAQREADMVKSLTEQAQQPGSVTEERIKELQKYLGPQ